MGSTMSAHYARAGNPWYAQHMHVAIIGCGLIGTKRASSLSTDDRLVAAADVQLERAQTLAGKCAGCLATNDWRQALRGDIDAVIVSTTNDMLAPITLAALEAGKHVLVEKPAARNAAELVPVIEAQPRTGKIVKVGFNLRFHPAIARAKRLVDEGAVGPLMFLRARYGHGGRLGMEKEWRGDPDRSGGGEMLDQGVHLIDLARWFLGEFVSVTGEVANYFWNWRVEDNGFALLKTAAGQIAQIHASCTEWKNLFSFEIYGKDGKLQIDGLGGSYGPERLTWYRMLPQMGPPEVTEFTFPSEDVSWKQEFEHFRRCIAGSVEPMSGLADAKAALDATEILYRK
jgi:predicted dehydrogenase